MGKMDYYHNLVLAGTVNDNKDGTAQFLLSDSNENVAYLVIKTGPYHKIVSGFYPGNLSFRVIPYPAEDNMPFGNYSLVALSKNQNEPVYMKSAYNTVDSLYYPDGVGPLSIVESANCGAWIEISRIHVEIDGQTTEYRLSETALSEYKYVSGYIVFEGYENMHFYPQCPVIDAHKLNEFVQGKYTPITPFTLKLYVDGDYNPNLKFTWNNNLYEPNDGDVARIYIKSSALGEGKDWQLYTLIPYDNGNYTCTFKDLSDFLDTSLWSYIVTHAWKHYSIDIRLEIYNRIDGVMAYSEWSVSSDGNSETKDKNNTTEDSGTEPGDGSKDDGYDDGKDDDSDDTSPEEGLSVDNLLTTSYALTETRLRQLSGFLWSADFIDNIKLLNNSPIENIISCKRIPFDINGTDESIVLGNVDTGVHGNKIDTGHSFTIGSASVSKKYNNFLDYSPYTNIWIFLPFIGMRQLDTDKYMGRTLKVVYKVDIVTGSCCACIYASNSSGKYLLIDTYNGSCGIDIPISAQNRSAVESAWIQAGLTSAITLSPKGAINGKDVIQAGMTGLDGAKANFHTSTTGNISSQCGAYMTRSCMLYFDRPTYKEQASYKHDVGKVCNLTRTIRSLSGYTEMYESIDLSGIPCQTDEMDELRKILSTGFYA